VVVSPVAPRGAPPVRPIAEFLLVLGGLKCAAAKENGDWLQIYTLSFFHLLAASALTVEPIFAVLFLAYLVLAPCVLVLLLLRREIAGSPSARRLKRSRLSSPRSFARSPPPPSWLFVSTLLIFIIFRESVPAISPSPFSEGRCFAGFPRRWGSATCPR
jgi:uncharacterized membrane protein YciS (DUF1049 family)